MDENCLAKVKPWNPIEVPYIYIYSILHILTIVFPDTRNMKYLPIFSGSYSMALLFVFS